MPGAPLPNHRLKLPTAGRLVGIRAAVACPTPAGEGMTPEERVSISDLQTLASAGGIEPMLPKKPLPWAMRIEHGLLGQREPVNPTAAQQAQAI